MYAYKSERQDGSVMSWTRPAPRYKPSLVFVSRPIDGMGGGYADAIDTDTTETECLNVSTEEPSSRRELRAVGCHVAALAAPQLQMRQNVGTANSSPHEPNITSTKSQSTPTYTHILIHTYMYIFVYLFIY